MPSLMNAAKFCCTWVKNNPEKVAEMGRYAKDFYVEHKEEIHTVARHGKQSLKDVSRRVAHFETGIVRGSIIGGGKRYPFF